MKQSQKKSLLEQRDLVDFHVNDGSHLVLIVVYYLVVVDVQLSLEQWAVQRQALVLATLAADVHLKLLLQL